MYAYRQRNLPLLLLTFPRCPPYHPHLHHHRHRPQAGQTQPLFANTPATTCTLLDTHHCHSEVKENEEKDKLGEEKTTLSDTIKTFTMFYSHFIHYLVERFGIFEHELEVRGKLLHIRIILRLQLILNFCHINWLGDHIVIIGLISGKTNTRDQITLCLNAATLCELCTFSLVPLRKHH